MGKRSGFTEDRDLSRHPKRELEFELTVWKGRAEAAVNTYQRKSAERRVHAIEKALASADWTGRLRAEGGGQLGVTPDR